MTIEVPAAGRGERGEREEGEPSLRPSPAGGVLRPIGDRNPPNSAPPRDGIEAEDSSRAGRGPRGAAQTERARRATDVRVPREL